MRIIRARSEPGKAYFSTNLARGQVIFFAIRNYLQLFQFAVRVHACLLYCLRRNELRFVAGWCMRQNKLRAQKSRRDFLQVFAIFAKEKYPRPFLLPFPLLLFNFRLVGQTIYCLRKTKTRPKCVFFPKRNIPWNVWNPMIYHNSCIKGH